MAQAEGGDERLRRLLGGAELEGLRRRLRARYETGKGKDGFTLTSLNVAERSALERLLGRNARTAGSMRLSVAELDAVVARAGLARDFQAALEKLDGPLIDRKAERLAHEARWNEVVAAVSGLGIRAAVADVEGAALLKRLARGDHAYGRDMLERAQRVLDRLPAAGIPLARLAAEALGDAHALDAGQPVATLVLRALSEETSPELPPVDEVDAVGPLARDWRRDQWARAGVTLNELAAPALFLNLCATDPTPAAIVAMNAASVGEPAHLSLRALLRFTPKWSVAGRAVHVCENSSIVAMAADRLRARCAALVCTDGMPGAAQQTLLRQLAHAGARLRYHGDFDWPGIAIANFVSRTFGASLWRYSVADYHAESADVSLRLSGRAVRAVWDAELADAMSERGVAIHEEAVVESLLEDLAAAG